MDFAKGDRWAGGDYFERATSDDVIARLVAGRQQAG